MDDKILQTLEYAKIVYKLTQHAATSLGKAVAEAVRPSSDLEEVKRLLQVTDEAYKADRLERQCAIWRRCGYSRFCASLSHRRHAESV